MPGQKAMAGGLERGAGAGELGERPCMSGMAQVGRSYRFNGKAGSCSSCLGT